MINGSCYVDRALIFLFEVKGDAANGLEGKCDLLRSLHLPGAPLVLPNAWDAATARVVAAAGFPAVATTSAGVAAALGYEDHEGAPAGEMLAAAAQITRSVDVPVTVDAEAGYGMTAAELVAELKGVGAAGCNLEDTSHATATLRDLAQQAELAGLGVARVGYASSLHRGVMEQFGRVLASLAAKQGEHLRSG
jgi:2-methylisocitrate lyase-like PEP mutase family enzyme